ncbi:hypothetical protein ACFV80_28430 [Streptomyces sp. NPDC059862]|uniref:hypothetical protein n=1 Tax=Streptomyces sp. NPDC059862 TaxID=3346975 RepID=UPI00364DEA06
MSNAPAYGAYRTGRLWAAAGVSFGVLFVGSGFALLSLLEFDERCSHGMVQGPGRLRDVRNQAFPPATICEFEGGDVSAGGTGILGAVLWLSLLALAVSVVAALLAECFEPPAEHHLAEPVSRADKLRRTGTAFFVTGSVFLMFYALVAWQLFTGPSSSCSAGSDWGSNSPRTLDYSFFPPQATCQYSSGMTRQMVPEWAQSLAVVLAVPALIAGVGFVLAWRRWWSERRRP